MTTSLVKPIRRLVSIAGTEYVVELSRAGVSFRLPKTRKAVGVAPLNGILALAVNLRLQEDRRERIRTGVMRRLGR